MILLIFFNKKYVYVEIKFISLSKRVLFLVRTSFSLEKEIYSFLRATLINTLLYQEDSMKNRYVLTIVAHSDDQVFGPGGTVIKYAKEGIRIVTIIFSYGEKSHPYLKKELIRDVRIEESEHIDERFLDNGKTIFLGLTEGKFKEEFESKKVKKQLQDLLLLYKPEKIFTHAQDDPHPDHLAVNRLLLKTYDELHEKKNFTTAIYTFGVWRFLKLKKRNYPLLVVDISSTFKDKIKALNLYKSQKVALAFLKWSVYLKAFFGGLAHHVSFAEEFEKIR